MRFGPLNIIRPLLCGSDPVRQKKLKVSLDAFDPLVLLLCSRSRDPVKRVVALDDAAVCLRLAGFDHLVFVVGDEKLEAVLGARKDRTGRKLCVKTQRKKKPNKHTFSLFHPKLEFENRRLQ